MPFPTNPSLGTTHGIENRVWFYNGYAWEKYDSTPNEVYSINGYTGDIGLVAGYGITLSISGKTFTISSTITGITGGTSSVGPIGPTGPTGATGAPGSGAPGNNDVGVLYLKNNTTPTDILAINDRQVVAGATYQTGLLYNFQKSTDSNGKTSLEYIGTGGRFHIIATFNFYSGNNSICGFYIGHNTVAGTTLDPNANRISESEIYANSSNSSDQPVGCAVQTVRDLSTNDRIFVIAQNKDKNDDITVEFMKLVVSPLTSERGATGATGASPTQYVSFLNGFTGGVTLSAGDGINISNSLNTVTITNTLYTLIDGGIY